MRVPSRVVRWSYESKGQVKIHLTSQNPATPEAGLRAQNVMAHHALETKAEPQARKAGAVRRPIALGSQGMGDGEP